MSNAMKRPERSKPKRITTKNPPGGPATPGARGGKTIAEIAAEGNKENKEGTQRSK